MSLDTLRIMMIVLLYLLAGILVVNGFVLLVNTRRRLRAAGAIPVNASVVELREAEGSPLDAAQGPPPLLPVFEFTYEGETVRLMGAWDGKRSRLPRWQVGETVRLLYDPSEGTAMDWDTLRFSRGAGFGFLGFGVFIAVAAVAVQLFWRL